MSHELLLNIQPIINIGCLGSVSDGKSTLIEKLTGIKTQKHSNEKKRNITIKHGYANMKIWQTEDNKYCTTESNNCKLVHHISCVDCPGHQELIKTMLSSIVLLDGAFIIIAVDQDLNTKPQLIQHLTALKVGKVKKVIVCLNKIDLVSKDKVIKYKKEVDQLLLEYDIVAHAIIPTCFNKKIGIDYLINKFMELFNPDIIIKKNNDNPLFRISRSFDVNKPGTDWFNISGGVIGGTLFSGSFKIGDEIEIRPGYVEKKNGKYTHTPLITKIISLKSDTHDLNEILSGGLFGIGTDIDSIYCKNDKMIGDVVGLKNKLPQVYYSINLIINFIVKNRLNKNDKVNLQIGTKFIEAIITNINNNNYSIELEKPVCISENENIIICKKIDSILKIFGTGTILL